MTQNSYYASGNPSRTASGKMTYKSRRGNAVKDNRYNCWIAMKARCHKKTTPKYPLYGGRGISIDDRWLGRDGFLNFCNDMGPRPEGTSIDRIDNDGNYEPGNCRWATTLEQSRNKRSTAKKYSVNGGQYTIYELADMTKMSVSGIRNRINRGWTMDRAINTPVNRRKE